MDIVSASRGLMLRQTQKNKAPAWILTEMAIRKGQELSKKYQVDERLVLASLYLAHTVFSPEWKGDMQRNHPKLSSEFVKKYLNDWKVNKEEQERITNAIEFHHSDMEPKSRVAEIVRNAECFKFVSVEGALSYLHDLGSRGIPFKEAVERVLEKMEQKRALLTLDACKKEAEPSCRKIKQLFEPLKENF